MSKPVSPKPLRKVAAICAYSQDDPPLRNPMSLASPVLLRAAAPRARLDLGLGGAGPLMGLV